jgi:hypothetical protein
LTDQLCDGPLLTKMMEIMVRDEAPRLFAVVQEYRERVDCRVAAWGMAFEEHTDVVSLDGAIRSSTQNPADMLRLFAGDHITPRIVWFNPAHAK